MLTPLELRKLKEAPRPRRTGEDTVDLSIQPMVDSRHCREFDSRIRTAPKRRALTAQALGALEILRSRGHASKS